MWGTESTLGIYFIFKTEEQESLEEREDSLLKYRFQWCTNRNNRGSQILQKRSHIEKTNTQRIQLPTTKVLNWKYIFSRQLSLSLTLLVWSMKAFFFLGFLFSCNVNASSRTYTLHILVHTRHIDYV